MPANSEAVEALTDLRNLYIRAFFKHAQAEDLDANEAHAEQVRQGLEWFSQRDAIQQAQVRLIKAGYDLPVSWSAELSAAGEVEETGTGTYRVTSFPPNRDALRKILYEMETAILKLQTAQLPAVNVEEDPPGTIMAILGKVEGDLFRYLWKHPVAERSKVLAAVWSKTVQDETVDTTVRRVSNKLANMNSTMTIETKSGYIKLIRPDK